MKTQTRRLTQLSVIIGLLCNGIGAQAVDKNCNVTNVHYVAGNTLQVPCIEVGDNTFSATFKILPDHLWELLQATQVSTILSGARSTFSNNALEIPLIQLTDGSIWSGIIQATDQKSASGNVLFKLNNPKKLTATTDLGKVVFRIGNKTDLRRANANANENANKNNNGNDKKDDNQNTGNNGNQGNQSPQNITAAVLKVDHIELTGKSKTTLKISGDIDLLKVINGEPQLLGEVVLPANTHLNQLRLILAEGSYVIADGQQYPLEIPSGEQTGLKINGDWGITGGQITSVQLDFNADDIRFNKAQGYRIKPTVKVANVILAEANDGEIKPETDSAITTSNSVVVSPDSEAVLKIGEGLQLTIPKGAVSETTVISGEETKTFMEYLDPTTGLIRTKAGLSSIYHLQPNGITFNTPIKVTVPYNVKALTSPEKEDKIVIFHDGDPIPSIIDKQKHTVTSEVQHFTSIVASIVNCNKEGHTNISGNNAMKYAKCVGEDFDFHIAKADRTLAKEGYELRILGYEENGFLLPQRIQTLAAADSFIAINGSDFSLSNENAYGAKPNTSLIINGKKINDANDKNETIMVFNDTKDGVISVSSVSKEKFDFKSKWAFGAEGFLKDGECLNMYKENKLPVSAIGYSKEKIVFLSNDYSSKNKEKKINAFLCNAFTDEGILDAVLLNGGVESAQLVVDQELKNPNLGYKDNAIEVAYGIGLVKIPAEAQCRRDKLNCADKLGRVIKSEGLTLIKVDSTTLLIPLGTKFTIKEVTTERNFKVAINTYDSEGKLVELFGIIRGNSELDRWEIFDGDINNANVETRVATVSANARLYSHVESDSTLLDCYGTGCRDVPKTFYVHKFFDPTSNPFAAKQQGGCTGHRWALASYKGLSRDFVGIEVAKMAYVCSVAFLNSGAMNELFEQDCKITNKLACANKIGRVINPNGMTFYDDKASNAEKTLPLGTKFTISGETAQGFHITFNAYKTTDIEPVRYSGNVRFSDFFGQSEVFNSAAVYDTTSKIKPSVDTVKIRLFPHVENDTPMDSQDSQTTFYVHKFLDVTANPYNDRMQGACNGRTWAVSSYKGDPKGFAQDDGITHIAKIGYVCDMVFSLLKPPVRGNGWINTEGSSEHKGADIFAFDLNLGSNDRGTPVYPVAQGKIIKSSSSYGTVMIQHDFPLILDDGSKINPWFSVYLHMEQRASAGLNVTPSDQIGVIDSVGADNPHLHFAIYNSSKESIDIANQLKSFTSFISKWVEWCGTSVGSKTDSPWWKLGEFPCK
jgi:hypothetical protein